MTVAKFNVLDFHEQIFFALDANYIADRIKNQYQVYLYYLDGIFVEIWYHLSQDEVIRFSAFMESHFLEPYLEFIYLAHLEE